MKHTVTSSFDVSHGISPDELTAILADPAYQALWVSMGNAVANYVAAKAGHSPVTIDNLQVVSVA